MADRSYGYKDTKSPTECCFLHSWKMFSIRSEMRSLKISQIQRHTNPHRYVYTELVMAPSKSYMLLKKTISLFACPKAGECCPLHNLDLYLSKLPQEVIKNGVFFAKPLDNTTEDGTKPWYSRTPVGRNTLDTKLCKMCSFRHQRESN